MTIWEDESRFPQGGDFVLGISTDVHPVQSSLSASTVSSVVYLVGSKLFKGFVASLDITNVPSTFVSQVLSGIASTSPVYSFEAEYSSLSFLYIVSNSFTVYGDAYSAPSTVSSYSRLAQFNPGQLPHLDGIFSDLYRFDVFSKKTHISKDDLWSVKNEVVNNVYPKSSLYTGSVVSTEYYTTISGETDICLGDNEPPFITLHSPTISGAHLRSVTQNIDFSLSDTLGGVDLSTVKVDITSVSTSGTVTIVQNGIDQTSGAVSVVGSSASYRFTYTPPFTWNNNEKVLVTISGTDLPPMVGGNPFFCGVNSSNTFLGDIPFQVLNTQELTASVVALGDESPPYIDLTVPASGTNDNNVFTSVSLHVLDALTGVDLTTLDVSVAGQPIINSGVPVSTETVITGGLNDYSVVYTPVTSFLYGSVNQVEVSVTDRAIPTPNVSYTSYTFSCIPDSTLTIENFKPDVGTHVDPETLDVSVDITDNTYGIDGSQTFFVINGTVVSGTKTVITDGFRMVYHPPNDFAYNEPMRVTVHAVNTDLVAPVVKEEFYSLFYGCRVSLHNTEAYAHQTDVDVFVRARNLGSLYKDLTTGYFFTTYTQPDSDMSASIQGVVPYVELPTTLVAQGPEHVYGRTVSVEFSVEDFEGRILGPYFFTYTIETRPE